MVRVIQKPTKFEYFVSLFISLLFYSFTLDDGNWRQIETITYYMAIVSIIVTVCALLYVIRVVVKTLAYLCCT